MRRQLTRSPRKSPAFCYRPMDFQTRFVLCSAPAFLRGRAFLPILPPQTGPQSISRCRASSSYTLHIQAGVCKLVLTNILYSIRYPRSCQAPRIAFKIISDDFSRLLYGSKKRAEPAFTSAEVRHTSKSCSRGRFYAISYTSKNAGIESFDSSPCTNSLLYILRFKPDS